MGPKIDQLAEWFVSAGSRRISVKRLQAAETVARGIQLVWTRCGAVAVATDGADRNLWNAEIEHSGIARVPGPGSRAALQQRAFGPGATHHHVLRDEQHQ